ncbi:phosphatidylinositol-3-phosphate phosphatase [Nocardioides sp. JS614]|nr:phosphatidylinositol-3-phosphate phosphatase [Nocardioides sp. JS614]
MTRSPAPATTGHASRVSKVVVFIVENHSLDQMRDRMPFTYALATTYGHATGYTAMTHPSLPNYLAIVSGSTQGVTDDRNPEAHVLRGPTVLGKAVRAGHTAAVYAEGMPENCALTNGGTRYAVRHNPWTYFVDERSLCQQYDVALDALPSATTSGRLPTVSLVIPDLCNDAHDCSLASADAWLSKQITPLTEGPDWKSGHLAIVVTADEDDRHHGNNVLTLVANPALHGKVVTEPLNHLSLSRSLSEVSGSAPLNQAAGAPSLLSAFGLKTAP